jgi:hypothetical protein
VGVAVRGRPGEVDAVAGSDLANGVRLERPVARPQRSSRVDAVLDLARRPDRAVEIKIIRDAFDDLLQRRRDDIDRLPSFVMRMRELERLAVHERAKHAFHRVGQQPFDRGDRDAAQEAHAVFGGAPHLALADTADEEDELPQRRANEVAASHEPAATERVGQREGCRPADQRPVEVEEGGAVHADQTRASGAGILQGRDTRLRGPRGQTARRPRYSTGLICSQARPRARAHQLATSASAVRSSSRSSATPFARHAVSSSANCRAARLSSSASAPSVVASALKRAARSAATVWAR